MNRLRQAAILGVLVSRTAFAADFPSEAARMKIFDRVVAEIERIDGEGLPARKNRPEEWKTTTKKLREAARAAKSPIDFGQVFRRLDATYPNLHAHVTLREEYDIAANRLRPRIAARFAAEAIERGRKKFRYRIGSVDAEMTKTIPEAARPAVGDDLLAINGRSMGEWSRENFLYCKFPLREQCEANFFDHFRKALLSWDWRSPLEYTLRRKGRTWKAKIPVALPAPGGQTPASAPASEVDDCSAESPRYADFRISYKGLNVCAYESEGHAGVVVLRIASFAYRDLPKEAKVRSLKDEVHQFYDGFWKAKAPGTKKLVVDVIDNGGGDTSIEWYKIFYEKPFQEQFVEFKKLPELDDDRIRRDMFYEDAGKEIWFADLKKSGAYAKAKVGEFLPRVPQFCASDEESCAEGLFEPRPNGFKGEVRVLVNEWCVSTCTGFVWSMRDRLGKRVKLFGIPDSGDSAYARLYLDVYLDEKSPDGFRTAIAPRPGRTRQDLPEGAILRQQVTATRSTDAAGKVISAIPTPVDEWIPYSYRPLDGSWESRVFEAALAR